MGQRLVIEVVKDNEVVGSCYYHWSAYTKESARLVKTVIDALEVSDIDNLECKVIGAFETTGAKLEDDFEVEYCKKHIEGFDKYNFTCENAQRNNGLIRITQEGIDENHYWAEGLVRIDLTNETVDFEDMFIWGEDERYIEHYNISLDSVVKFDEFFLLAIPLEEFDSFLEKLETVDNYVISYRGDLLGVIA
jgi:hypothetical protein